MKLVRSTVGVWVLGCLGVVACGDEGGREGDVFSTSITTSPVLSATAADTEIGDTEDVDTEGDADDDGNSSNDTFVLDVASNDTSPDSDSGDCAEVSEQANVGPQPADILLVIDNSGSMDAEAAFVQQQMNSFSTQITAAAIDVHVILISALPGQSDAGVCIAPPLGSGGCPADESNLPTFHHVVSGVGSTNALDRVIQHFPDYQASLRATAALHVVVVSDDDSDLGADAFMQQFNALIPNPADLKFHGIVAEEGPFAACLASTSCCLTSAEEGSVYKQLITQTGGVYGNLCDQEFQPIFQAVATAVIQEATLACEFNIPAPPDGEEFDRDEVNVEFDDGSGNILQIGRVESPGECAMVQDGWYYDNPDTPTRIIVCPQTCDTIQGFDNASIAVKFGCATIPAG